VLPVPLFHFSFLTSDITGAARPHRAASGGPQVSKKVTL
jgi:hypothetical protein